MTETRTERLILRPFRPADAPAFAALNADARVMRHFPAPLTRAESDALMARIEAKRARDGICFEAVERRGDGALLGMVGLNIPDFEAPFTPCVEIGWRLAPAAWGRGYATEAARAALARGFASRGVEPGPGPGLGLDEIVSFTVPANAASLAVMARLGFRPDPAGDFDHPALPPGHRLRRHVLHRLPACAFAL